MKLLFDENLSRWLIDELADVFPDSQHVDLLGLHGQHDSAIWNYAREQDFAIVSKDNDFRQMSFLKGPPPKVIWLSVGNAGTKRIGALLRRSRQTLYTFEMSPDDGLLVLELSPTEEDGN